MKRLLEAELIYGRLLDIAEPHLIARYNKALEGFGLRPTALERFSIDMTGFSPEIADELGDRDYLDPNRVNRRFIIMTPDQAELPVVHTSFSNTAALMHEFFNANSRAINAVTIKDALYGEIEDSVSIVDDIDDLLSINEVRFRVLSAEDMLGKAAELRSLVDRLKKVPTAWTDDEMLNRMVELAKVTGDIRQNALVPDQLVFRHDAFWANHFGGVYVFLDEKTTTVICDPSVPGFRRSRPWQVSYIAIDDHARIYDFLASTKRLQLPQASWVEDSGLYQHRADMVVRGLINDADPTTDLARADRIWLQTWMHRNAALVAQDATYPFLQEMQRMVQTTGSIRMQDVAPANRFMLVRAAPVHPDQWLVNRLIAQLVPRDFVSRFVFDKQGFYDAYERYSEKFREYVVTTLTGTYLKDKAAFRRKLYGLREE
ncbi:MULTISPECIES: DUF6638 family protein [Ensifer]|jgi:hypothetical protein|uniref:Uncharacterized protein n=1 Tax=Ensifer canadensis TaxID=555315 RepID=A0AAW4FHX8_9HYPH|nr:MULTISPECIES: DUF6638 family protein [Ensifer]AHK45092.1 hypothetical protein OV14_3865 [Ensifer adhaerens OV14]MDP9630201.1 hypothetical protein [Ensifer adhaerens]KQU94452.1 hypothetical protein ASD00_21205 [Ensifer sp. Root31]KQW56061.1 hypothetical protein ASD02_29885 [Ensifer sp. Root1252]KQW83360.1 hypothetical protein ASD03_21995 [Ensifer sp. Root127]